VVPSVPKRARHMLGVPLWPVRITHPDFLLVKSVRVCGTFKRVQQNTGRLTIE
jgi:hypothetical protein